MGITVKGVYRNGHVELLEKPEGVDQAEVVVTFPDAGRMVQDEASREARRQTAVKWLRETGWNLGGPPYPTRDELHDRTR
jgi:hypothetical protein